MGWLTGGYLKRYPITIDHLKVAQQDLTGLVSGRSVNAGWTASGSGVSEYYLDDVWEVHDLGSNQEGADGFSSVGSPTDNGDYYTFDGSSDGLYKGSDWGNEGRLGVIAKFRAHDREKGSYQTIWKSGGATCGMGIGIDDSGNLMIGGADRHNLTSITIPPGDYSDNTWYIVYAFPHVLILCDSSGNEITREYGEVMACDGSNEECIGYAKSGTPLGSGNSNSDFFDGDIAWVEVVDRLTAIFDPDTVIEDGGEISEGTVGSLSAGEYVWDNNDSLRRDHLYVRLSDDDDPDNKSNYYLTCSWHALENFTFVIKIPSDSDLASYAAADGSDFRVTESDGETLLDFERVRWTSGTGELIMFIEVPELANDADDEFYLYFDNTVADGEDVEGTWSSRWKFVHHFEEQSSSYIDSTSNNEDSDVEYQEARNNSGVVGYCPSFRGTTGDDDRIRLDDAHPVPIDENWVVFNWLYVHQYGSQDGWARRHFIWQDSDESNGVDLAISNGGYYCYRESNNGKEKYCTTGVTLNQWEHIVWMHHGKGNAFPFLNGQLCERDSGGIGSNSTGNTQYGRGYGGPGKGYFDGLMDESKIAASSLSHGFVTTVYQTESQPESGDGFWTLGSLETSSGGYTLTVDQASIYVTGQDVTLTTGGAIGYEIDVDQASINLTSYDVGLKAGITITVDQASIEVTGQDVGLTAEIAIALSWTDNAEHEDGFTIERQTDGGAWVEVVSGLAPDTESYNENMEAGHTYNYRVKATSSTLGDSEWSNEDSVTV